MKKQTVIRHLFSVLLPLLVIALAAKAQEPPATNSLTFVGPGQRYTENISVIDVRNLGYQPVMLPTGEPMNNSRLAWSGGSDPNNPYAIIRKTGPTFMQPGGTARYEITLSNFENITHTFQVTDTLPPQLTYVPNSANELVYDAATRALRWQGELSPGNLEYVIDENSIDLPYLDLAAFGAVNLCADFIANGETCDDVSVTFNLGVNGYTTNLYGEVLSQLTVSSNGLILTPNTAVSNDAYGHNQWLPDVATPGFVLAGLWRDVIMGVGEMAPNGRFHAAIISGLIEGHNVFYAQWHDAPQANDPDLTARHAIAILLNDEASASAAQVMAGQAFFIYDNVSDPARLVAQGYTIGVADKLGARGTTYAYAPCCGDSPPAQGYPPASGTTLHLRPLLFGAEAAYSRTFSYEAVVNAPVPETIINTAVTSSSSADPALAYAWSTHYLYVRRQTYLPVVVGGGE